MRASIAADFLGDALAVTSRDYRLIVAGELSDAVEPAFDGMRLERQPGVTVLAGSVRDQAELQSLIQRVSDLGLTLLSVASVDPCEPR